METEIELFRAITDNLYTAVLGDVLDVARIEAGQVDLAIADYDVRRLLEAVAGVLRPTLRARPLELHVTVGDDVPGFLRGDAANSLLPGEMCGKRLPN